MSVPEKITMPTRVLSAELVELLRSLKLNDRIELNQTVRVGGRKWQAVTQGVFRGINYLSTGITTDRVKQDDIIVPTIHFTKDNGELASITLDEHTQVSRLS